MIVIARVWNFIYLYSKNHIILHDKCKMISIVLLFQPVPNFYQFALWHHGWYKHIFKKCNSEWIHKTGIIFYWFYHQTSDNSTFPGNLPHHQNQNDNSRQKKKQIRKKIIWKTDKGIYSKQNSHNQRKNRKCIHKIHRKKPVFWNRKFLQLVFMLFIALHAD